MHLLYKSPRIGAVYNRQEDFPLYILSAEYGLVHCDEVRASYDRRMDSERAEKLAPLVAEVMRRYDWLVFFNAQTPLEYARCLEDALTRAGPPEIFNTDQGAQFTSQAFTTVLKTHAVAISMDGKGRWVDNVFVERLWRSVKYEDVYLHAYETPASLRAGLTGYFQFYTGRRRHRSRGRRTPDVVSFGTTGFGTAA